MENTSFPKDLHSPELNEFVEKLLKSLADKNQIIQNQNLELETLNNLIFFYRDQFQPKKCENCEKSIKSIESLNLALKSLEKDLEKKEFLLKEVQISNEENMRKFEEIKGENRRFSNENKLLKSQLQGLKEKGAVNEKYIETLKKDSKNLNEDKEKLNVLLKDSDERLLILQAKLLEKPLFEFSRNLANEDLFLEEEIEKFQHGMDNLEALNQNIQGSLAQFQISNMKRNSRNMSITPTSKSIDLTRMGYISPKNAKNPSFSFISGQAHAKLMPIALENSNERTQSVKEENNENEEKRISYYITNNNTLSGSNLYINNAIETINEEEKDLELDLDHRNSHKIPKETLIKEGTPIVNTRETPNMEIPNEIPLETKEFKRKTQKCKSLTFSASNSQFFEQSIKRKTKSLLISNQPLDPTHLNELLNLTNLETDCFGVLKILIDGNLNLVKDFQNKLSMNSKRINRNFTEIQEFLQIDASKEDFKEFLLKERVFNKEISEDFKDYLLNASDMIKVLIETGVFVQKAQQLCETLNISGQEKEMDLKNKLEEIVKLHQNIIDLEKKEINFEENINEVYEKYMLVIEEKDLEWRNFDRFKKFTRIIENYVQERLQIKGFNKELETLGKENEDFKKKLRESQKENLRKNEGIIRIENREKNIRKDRDFFYSQLAFFKKKILEQEFIGIDIIEIQRNEEEIQRFLKKYQIVECSMKTIVENLISYEENKNKETSN